MNERETLKHMLKQIIRDTENNKIKTTDEVIQTLVDEMTRYRSNSLSETNMSIAPPLYR
ncbi:hypothetical protein ACFSMW_18720 [Virgibacillus halophilus]|uniref:Uncharacterized protein n=1 Tax=Tigheibacillus halophilus TaxID=361280 RepID=A0ABU5C1S9_9BACI|nr:hypothetical protein [Virgibacillus halophilus]